MNAAAGTPGLAAYLSRPPTPAGPAVLAALESGPIDAAAALPLSQIDRLTDPAPLPAETGWCMLPDGVGYVAVRTEMPMVSGEMIDWWFEWHPREELRYRIWFPPAHSSNRFVQRTGAEGGAKALWGMTHFPVEDIGLGTQHLRIEFRRPTELGFTTDGPGRPEVATIVCGIAGDPRMRARHTVMAHVFLRRPEGEGLVLRSRFWIGAAIRPDLPAPLAAPLGALLNRRIVRRRMVPARVCATLAHHCAEEYANLAALLPELWPAYGPLRLAGPAAPAAG